MIEEEVAARARQLRLDGRSCAQIATELGISQRAAERLVRDLPVPEWTRRPRAKDELRTRARELREGGWTYPEIAVELGVSKSSCSLWLRDMPHPPARDAGRFTSERAYAIWLGRWQEELRRRNFERTGQILAASRQIGTLSDRELRIAGAVLYWAEGSKSKPWRRSEMVTFINSDPDLVRLYLAWLRLIGIAEDRWVLRVQIHESADVPAAVAYWADVTGVPAGESGEPRSSVTIRRRCARMSATRTVGASW